MIIKKIIIGLMQAPLKTPFKTALRTVNKVEDIVLMLETDTGHIGYGEAPATPVITGDTLLSVQGAVLHLTPFLLGKPVAALQNLTQIIQNGIVHNTSAKAALEIALYDLFAQSLNVPLYKVLGGSKTELETDCTISLNSVEEMLADCSLAVEEGFKALKIKVGSGCPEDDFTRLDAIMTQFSDRTTVCIDANQAWQAKDAVSLMQKLESKGYGFDFLEQPTKAWDRKGLKFIQSRIKTPVLADESAFSTKDVLKLLQANAVDLINIKLMKTGGISEAVKIANLTAMYGKKCMVGCMLESMISVCAAAHFASACDHAIKFIDLDGPVLCKSIPVVGGLEIDNKNIRLLEKPGLGIEKIEDYTVLHEIS